MRHFLLFAAVALLGWSCSKKDVVTDTPGGQPATLSVKIVGSKAPTRAAPTQAEENAVNAFTIYVFRFNNGSGYILEKVRTFNSSVLTQTLEGLTEGPKKIAVVANAPSNFPEFFVGDSYDRFSDVGLKIDLDTQQDLANSGLMMTGDVDVTLQPSPNNNTVEVPVSRIVAKIKLGDITLDPVQGIDPGLFALEAVLIMDAPSLSSVGLPNITTTPPLYGGLRGVYVDPENVRSYLYSAITLADQADRFFYVFADEATIITLVGTYDGVRGYFPFVIDPIQRNTQHAINITLRRLGSGSPDPDVPSDPTTMDITVIPQDWIVVPTQNVTW